MSHGLIPKKYGVSEFSTRTIAQTGHISPELDIIFYDSAEAIVVKRFSGTLDYFPIESVHGTIQVKSRLTKTELKSALKNIRDFKALRAGTLDQKVGGLTASVGLYQRSGIIFAYEYDLDWQSICNELELFIADNDPCVLPNAIFILNKGFFRFGSKEKCSVYQKDLNDLTEAVVYGAPDHDGSCLLAFYSILIGFLKESVAGSPDIDAYLRLPLTVGRYSYSYTHGAFAEIGSCPVHGNFLKMINLENMEKIISVASESQPVNWIQALDFAQGKQGDDEESYRRQPGEVRIYNLEEIALSDLLMTDKEHLSFESIEVEDMTIWLPVYYILKDNLIDECQKCSAKLSKSAKNTNKK